MKKLEEISKQIDLQKEKNEKQKSLIHQYDVPTVDVYIELKLSLERLEKREEGLLRKKRLEKLAIANIKAKNRVKETQSKLPKRKAIAGANSSLPGRLFQGPTFNIVYNVPDKLEK